MTHFANLPHSTRFERYWELKRIGAARLNYCHPSGGVRFVIPIANQRAFLRAARFLGWVVEVDCRWIWPISRPGQFPDRYLTRGQYDHPCLFQYATAFCPEQSEEVSK